MEDQKLWTPQQLVEVSIPQNSFEQEVIYNGIEGIATATFRVDSKGIPITPIIVAFAPQNASENSRPAAVKIPIRFIEELTTLPIEIQGIPIQILIKLAHEIQKYKQKEIICQVL